MLAIPTLSTTRTGEVEATPTTIAAPYWLRSPMTGRCPCAPQACPSPFHAILLKYSNDGPATSKHIAF
jgi:hypothetical protein